LRGNRKAQLVTTQPTSEPPPASGNRKVIHGTCALHHGSGGFRQRGGVPNGQIVFAPHITGAYVLTLGENETCALRDVLKRWLG